MHMHFQYIKCWLDKEIDNLVRLIKSPDFFCDLYFWDLILSITSRNKIHVYGSRSENM